MLHRMFTGVHLITLGCDTTSKFNTKRVAYQAKINFECGLSHSFGKESIAGEVVHNAEQFLVLCIAKSVVFQHVMV